MHAGCLPPWCPSMTKRDKQVCSEHILVLLCAPAPPPPLFFITPTRATQSSSLSTAPIHQHAAITCRCSVMDYFPCADALADQTLRKWQIRSLCPFMITSLVYFFFPPPPCVCVYLMQVCIVLYKTHFSSSCTSKESKVEERRWVWSFQQFSERKKWGAFEGDTFFLCSYNFLTNFCRQRKCIGCF